MASSDIPTRRPTFDEAVRIMHKAMTDQQRRANLAHWRSLYGDSFADRVAAEVERKK